MKPTKANRQTIMLCVMILLGAIFILSVTANVSAAPPVTTVQSITTGYSIVDPPQSVLEQNHNFQYNFFLQNISNGLLLDNVTGVYRNCTFFLADLYGQVIYIHDVPYFADGHWGINLAGGNFSRIGEYAYGVRCQSSALGGSISGKWIVTKTGLSLQSTSQGLGSLSFLILMISLTGLFGWIGFKLTESKSLWVLGIFMLFLSILFVTYDVWLGYEYQSTLTGTTSTIPQTIFYIFLFLVVAGLLVCLALLFTRWKEVVKYLKDYFNKKEEDTDDDFGLDRFESS